MLFLYREEKLRKENKKKGGEEGIKKSERRGETVVLPLVGE